MGRMIDRLFAALGMIGPHKVTFDLDEMTPSQRAWHEAFRLGREAHMKDRQAAVSHPLHRR